MSDNGTTKVVADSGRHERNGTGRFANGHKKLGGRKRGTPNRFTADIQAALIEAVNRFGADGKGHEGMVGFLMRACKLEPAKVLGMLQSAMPRTINAKITETRAPVSYAEAREVSIGRPLRIRLMGLIAPH
jgi:hypothetical protein